MKQNSFPKCSNKFCVKKIPKIFFNGSCKNFIATLLPLLTKKYFMFRYYFDCYLTANRSRQLPVTLKLLLTIFVFNYL